MADRSTTDWRSQVKEEGVSHVRLIARRLNSAPPSSLFTHAHAVAHAHVIGLVPIHSDNSGSWLASLTLSPVAVARRQGAREGEAGYLKGG